MSEKTKKILAQAIGMGAILAAVWIVYYPALNGDFQFDDLPHVKNNQAVKLKSFSAGGLWEAVSESPLKNRPLVYLTFAIDHVRAGESPGAYHATNVFIHMATVVLAWIFLRLLFTTEPFSRSIAAPRAAAILGAGLFALNPVQTQSVTYIVQRMNLMAAFFVLASLTCLLFLPREGVKGRPRLAAKAGIIVFALFALLCKENAFSIFLLIPLIVLCMNEKSAFELAKEKYKELAILCGLAFFIALTLLVRGREFLGGEILSGYQYRDFTMWERLMTQPRVLLWYVGLWLFPAEPRLSVEHDFALSTGLFSPAVTLPAIMIVAAGAGLALYYCRRRPLLCLGWLWFLASLSIESSILPLETAFEHRLYLPSPGLVMMAAALVPGRERGRITAVLITASILSMSVITWSRNQVWKDTSTLWDDAAHKAPGAARPFSNLCAGEYVADNLERAVKVCRLALSLDAKDAAAWHNLGLSLFKLGKTYEAEKAFTESARLDPDWPETSYQLARTRVNLKLYAEALPPAARAVRFAPDDPYYLYELGLVQGLLQMNEESLSTLEKARENAGRGDKKLIKEINTAIYFLKQRLKGRSSGG